MSDEKKIEFNQSDVINALLHAKQSEHHYATQESVDNLKERMNEKFAAQNEKIDAHARQANERFEQVDKRFEQVDKRFEQVDKRFDKLEGKIDRLQWLIIASALAVVFKDNLFKLFA